VNLPKEHFRALVIRLLGDKDHTKVYEAVAKVEKAMSKGRPWSGSSQRWRSSDVPYKGRGMRSSAPIQCYFCGKFGHIMARCYARRDMQRFTAAWVAQLVGRQSAVREVEGSSPRPDQHSGS